MFKFAVADRFVSQTKSKLNKKALRFEYQKTTEKSMYRMFFRIAHGGIQGWVSYLITAPHKLALKGKVCNIWRLCEEPVTSRGYTQTQLDT